MSATTLSPREGGVRISEELLSKKYAHFSTRQRTTDTQYLSALTSLPSDDGFSRGGSEILEISEEGNEETKKHGWLRKKMKGKETIFMVGIGVLLGVGLGFWFGQSQKQNQTKTENLLGGGTGNGTKSNGNNKMNA